MFGDLDTCHFHVECAFPVGYIADAGRAVTNLSYMFTGFTLLLLAFAHARSARINGRSGESEMGVQHDYDMVRAICYWQIAQGVTGFIYHLCPNESGK